MAAALASSRCCGRPPLLPTGRGRRSVARCALSGEKGNSFSWKECAISVALSVGLITGPSTFGWSAHASPLEPVIPDISVLISGPPIKDPGALLRYALPIDNKAIREVQKPLEDITDSLKVAGVRALDSVERNVRQASRALSNGRSLILTGLAESKRANGEEILDKLAVGLEELQRIVEDRNRKAVAPKQKELLNYVGTVEEDMVDGFPYEVPEEYNNMPLLKGRATVDMKVKIKDNPKVDSITRFTRTTHSPKRSNLAAMESTKLSAVLLLAILALSSSPLALSQDLGPLAPVIGAVAPVLGSVAPVVGSVAPVVGGGLAPVIGQAAPQVGQLAPVVGQVAPVIGGGLPGIGAASPVLAAMSTDPSTLAPVVGGAAPVVGGAAPVIGGVAPVVGGGVPGIGAASPVLAAMPTDLGTLAPVVGGVAPVVGSTAPVVGSVSPVIGSGIPGIGAASPVLGAMPTRVVAPDLGRKTLHGGRKVAGNN